MTVVAVIPARYGSTRFPGKPLADRTGKPLIRHVVERAAESRRVERIVVATDDERIATAVRAFGCEAIMTSPDHENGTSRIAEAVATIDCDIVVNVQGDEPGLEPSLIDATVEALEARPDCPMATVASPFAPDEDPNDPNVVKVVVSRRGTALYFSRAPIPHWRDRERIRTADATAEPPAPPLKHVGLYVYRKAFLAEFVAMPPSPLERTESLEQLRVLDAGRPIAVAIGHAAFQGIDTPEQYERWVEAWRAAGR